MRTTRELVQMANRLFNYDLAPPHVRRHNRRQWIRSVQNLGPRWLIWDPIKITKEEQKQNASKNS